MEEEIVLPDMARCLPEGVPKEDKLVKALPAPSPTHIHTHAYPIPPYRSSISPSIHPLQALGCCASLYGKRVVRGWTRVSVYISSASTEHHAERNALSLR